MTRFEDFGSEDQGRARLTQVEAPGTGASFAVLREAVSGGLLRVSAGGRTYLDHGRDGWTRLDGGLGRYREERQEAALLRRVQTPHGAWVERYGFDSEGRVDHVDGVDIRRDGTGRVTACLGGPDLPGHRWIYGYSGAGLTSIEGPQGLCHLSRLADGRVTAVRDAGGQARRLDYDRKGRMRGVPTLPDATHHRDAAGRVWSVTDGAGRVRTTWIWDGWRCIGRIDGPPGDPLAAYFSLDPSATPVRVLSRDGTIRIPRDAFGMSLTAHPGVPGLFGAVQSGGWHHLPWRTLDPRIGAFAAPDPFDGSEDDPRRAGGAYEGDLDVETDRQRPYDVCQGDPVSRADPSGGISAGLMISSLTWSFQNNLVSFFGLDWWFNLFGSMFTGADFFDSEGLVASDHIGAVGVRRNGVVPDITGGRAFTTQHIVWDWRESFAELNDGMLVDPAGRFDPPLRGGPLLGQPEGLRPFVLRGRPTDGGLNWNRAGGTAEPAFPGASQPVFPSGGFHFTAAMEGQRGPADCTLTELTPGPITRATADPEGARQRFQADESAIPAALRAPIVTGDPVLLEHMSGERLRTRIATFRRVGSFTELTVMDQVPDTLGPSGITLLRLDGASTSEPAQDPGGGVQGFSARGLVHAYPPADWLEIRSQAGGDDVTLCHATRAEARIPLNAAVPAGMGAPMTVSSTTLSPTIRVTLDGIDGLAFPAGVTPPGSGTVGLVSNGGAHVPVRITGTAAGGVVRTDSDLSALGASGTPVGFRTVLTGPLLGRRAGAPEADAWITYDPAAPGVAPDPSGGGPVVVMIAGAGGLPDAARLVTGAPIHDAILTDQPITPAAPWTIQRFSAASGPDTIVNLQTVETIAVTPDSTDALADASAIRVFSLRETGGVPDLSASAELPGLAMAGRTATVTRADTQLDRVPRVADIVALDQAGGVTYHALADMRQSFDFDRDVDIDPDTPGYVVRLRPAGFAWTGDRVGALRVTVTPFVDGTRSQFPRIRTGAAVYLQWEVGGSRSDDIYRVGAVEGLTLTLEGPTTLPPGLDAGTLTVQLLEADDPGTGHQKIAVNLGRPAGAAATQAEADIWSPDAFNAGPAGGGAFGFGLVSRGVTTPVRILPGNRTLTLRFSADTGLSGSADLFATSTAQTWDQAISNNATGPYTLADSTTALAACFVVSMHMTDTAADSARFLPGDVIIPNEEHMEISRNQALTDHELEHTAQYHRFGPIWFCYFPLFLLELPVELATDLDQPDFGPSTGGTLARVGARVRITPATDLDLSGDDEVQIFQNGNHETLTVASMDGGTIVLRGSSSLGEGAVELRKVQSGSELNNAILGSLRIGTHGGLLNTAVGFTWGGLLFLLSKGIYGAIRAMGGAGDQYPGLVIEGGTAIDLTDEDGQRALNAEGQFIIKSGQDSVVRRATRTDRRLVLDQPVALTGQVQVSAFTSLDPGSAFDWLRYRPGTIDQVNPMAVHLADSTGFSVGDRIEYIYLGRTGRTHVSGVTDGRIELEEAPAISGSERSIRLALLAEAGTTLGNADEAALNWMGMGWMRLLFDPYGQIEARVRPEATWSQVLLRVMRVIMGSRNWSILPMLGYVFWARLTTWIPERRATIEQQSSEMSGDLYTSLARLNGEVRRSDRYAATDMAVGDIARYRFWPWTGSRVLSSIAATADDRRLGAPGLHMTTRDLLRVVVNRIDGPDTLIPNRTTITDPAGAFPPALGLPDRLFTKNSDATLGALPASEPLGFAPADLGNVPLSPALIRNPSAYVAFTRPGSHRATVVNSDFTDLDRAMDQTDDRAARSNAQALDAQDHERQNLIFDITAHDVTVTVNGHAVAEGDTVALVQTQSARIAVTTTGPVAAIARSFRATIRRPLSSPILRSAGALRLVAQGANTGGTPEWVEVSRFYDFDEATGRYADPALALYGMHLGGDFDVPVRGFDITVTDRLSLLAAPDPDAAPVTALVQGDTAFLLIPTMAGEGVTVTINGAPPAPGDPVLSFDTVTADPAAAAAVGPLGQVRSVRFAADPPLAAAAPVELSIPVTGEDGASGTLRVSLTLEPPPSP